MMGFGACKRKEGCTDPTATNFDSDAEKDDGSCTYATIGGGGPTGYTVPTTYNYTNVTYTGQTVRLLLLKDLTTEMASGTASAASLNAIYFNTNTAYADIASPKNLEGKVGTQAVKDSVQIWFGQIDAMNGGFIRSDSVDLKQMVEKTLMGAVFFYQAYNDYLAGITADNNSNVTPGKGTDMEHHWEEGFGYFGAARDYNNYTDAEIKSPGEKDSDGGASPFSSFPGNIDPASEKCFYFAQTAAKRDIGSANFSAASRTNYTKVLFDAWLKGRAAISNTDFATRDAQVVIIQDNWEKIIAATAVHYINETKADLGAGPDWSGLKKHWSELKGYFNMIPHHANNKLGGADIATINGYIGKKPGDATVVNLDLAAALIKSAYGFTDEQIAGW